MKPKSSQDLQKPDIRPEIRKRSQNKIHHITWIILPIELKERRCEALFSTKFALCQRFYWTGGKPSTWPPQKQKNKQTNGHQPTHRPTHSPTNQPNNQPIKQPTNNQPTGQPSFLSFFVFFLSLSFTLSLSFFRPFFHYSKQCVPLLHHRLHPCNAKS